MIKTGEHRCKYVGRVGTTLFKSQLQPHFLKLMRKFKATNPGSIEQLELKASLSKIRTLDPRFLSV